MTPDPDPPADAFAGDTGPLTSPRRVVRRSLLWRLFSTNAAVLVISAVALLASPVTVSWPPNPGEILRLTLGVVVLLGANLVVMRHLLGPLGRLRAAMIAVDPLRPGQRIDVGARSIEVMALTAAFNDMLDRLERERRDSARRTLAAQEAERRWLSLELHDEIGQSMTALLLQLDVAQRTATPSQTQALSAAIETARDCLGRVRVIVRRLRPEVLDDLGLVSAVAHLCDSFSATAGINVQRELERSLPKLTQEAELVVFRVAQESLTNVARHAGATNATVELCSHHAGVRLRVTDDGLGVSSASREGTGIRGMRERALMIGSTIRVAPAAPRGTEIVLDLPRAEIVA